MNRQRGGRINVGWMAFVLSVVVFAALVAVLAWKPRGQAQGTEPIVLYCAAGIRVPVEAVAKRYEQEFGVKIQLEYGGSQTLLAQAELSRKGDLYLPADDSYVAMARKKQLLDEVVPVARMRPVLAVQKGNPKGIRTLDDVLRAGVRLAMANPDAAAVGKVTREALTKAGRWEAVNKHTTVFKPTVNEVANDVKLGTVDAAFVWDVTVRQYPELQGIELRELDGVEAHISIAVLHNSARPIAGLRFARYLSACDKGLVEFKKAGFEPIEGDGWTERPEMLLLSGAMLRPAIEETIVRFEFREGARVNRVYNGCGILVAQMKAGQRPDAYFSCDTSFMSQVADMFMDIRDISWNPMMIVVPRSNPKQIRTLVDLGRAGLKVGLAHEQQSALGALTRKVLLEAGGGIYEAVRKNLAVESATGDLLVNQLRAGSLDAIIVYVSNTAASKEHLEVVAIELASASATQPMGIGRESKNKQLASRLAQAIRSAESRGRFVSLGFGWKVPAE